MSKERQTMNSPIDKEADDPVVLTLTRAQLIILIAGVLLTLVVAYIGGMMDGEAHCW